MKIISEKRSYDVGFYAFNRFRNIVAKKIDKHFHDHYSRLSRPEVMAFLTICTNDEILEFKKNFDFMIEQFIKQKIITKNVANFLTQSACGKINGAQAKEVYELIKDCDNDIIFGFAGRKDCTKMSDLKKIFSDGIDVQWY